MAIDLASLHLRLWRLHLTVDLEIEEREEAEPRLMPHLPPKDGIEGIELIDTDTDDRLGFH